jgi:hypothetical protein
MVNAQQILRSYIGVGDLTSRQWSFGADGHPKAPLGLKIGYTFTSSGLPFGH